MSEMTVTEHNEQLVLEKRMLEQQIMEQQNHLGLILAGMMRQTKRKTVTLKPENMVPPGVHIHTDDKGVVKITFQEPREPDGQA